MHALYVFLAFELPASFKQKAVQLMVIQRDLPPSLPGRAVFELWRDYIAV